jgi:hypothetical protein
VVEAEEIKSVASFGQMHDPRLGRAVGLRRGLLPASLGWAY